MNALGIILFLLAFVNLITISLMIYLKKKNWAISLSIFEIVLVYLATMNLNL